jgi:two-component system nitrogen regulation sensor histidine kinase NtrY
MGDTGPKQARFSAPKAERRLTTRLGPVVVVLALATALSSFLIFAGFTPITPTNSVLFSLFAVNILGILLVLGFVVAEAYAIYRARRAGAAGAQLHVRIVGLFSIIAVVPAVLMAWVGSVTLDRSLNPSFMRDGRGFVANTVEAARLFGEAQCRALLQEARLTASDLDRAKLMFELDRPLFREFFSSRARFLGFTAAALLEPDGTIIEQIETNSTIANAVVRPEKTDFEDATKNEPLCLILDEGRTFVALRTLTSFKDTFLYVARPVDPFTVEFPREAAKLVALYDGFDSHRQSIQIAFATVFVLIGLIMLLSATWLGLSFANSLVAPIRRLIAANNEVSSGNLEVQVAVDTSEGDLANLGETFNKMTSELKLQQRRLVAASNLIDERRRFTEAVLSGVPVAVIGVGAKGEITVMNPSAERLVPRDGEGAEGLVGRALDSVLPEIAAVHADARSSHSRWVQGQISLTRGGLQRLFNVSITREPTEGGDKSFIVTLDDITDLVSAQRTAAWADVARRIAHEIRNPLTPIQLSAERIKRKYGKLITQDRDVFDQCTDTIVRQVDDIKRMVDEFSAFARMPKARLELDDLTDCLRRALFTMRVTYPDIDFVENLPEEVIVVRFDRRLISQALTNIMKNAAEGIAAVEADDGTKGEIAVSLGVGGGTVAIDVIDNGKGFPREDRQRLLEPYMTTRAEGTGLGLPIVVKILTDHGGGLELRDKPTGRGAWVRLFFPRSDESEPSSDAADRSRAKEPQRGAC